MGLSLEDIPFVLLQLAALLIGLVVHESAHAFVAYLLGDRTAREQGRISLNPLNHIDPFGTVALPLLMLLAGGPVFAFAKPVPVYLGNLRHPKRDEVLVSLAGPASNLLLAVLAALIMRGVGIADATAGMGEVAPGHLVYFLYIAIFMNLSLCFFNLIPLPPLDGSSILVPFLRGRALEQYYKVQRYSMPILLTVLYLLPMVLNIDLVSLYFDVTVYPLASQLVSFGIG
ncbi:Putative zinc metalloprotease Rip2 [Collinsella sp. AK_207A]|uniref:site-2 protease family protein n=1 Tax=Collinsella sp. AK_207A TaxID=2650472 RepID=UPI00126070CA|nr:site-2 protease family protein [Collinsella sp. AK_207A]VWL97163.1 Putative zinc metalloprotease Rip2 [Collinsella sp. AK_207A]